jgi:hypothetical protein
VNHSSHGPNLWDKGHQTFGAKVKTAQVLRHVIKVNHGGESKTLEQMFDPDSENMSGSAWAMVSSMSKKASYLYDNRGKKLQRIESRVSSPSLIIGISYTTMISDGAFDDERKSYAGIRPVPRSIYDLKQPSESGVVELYKVAGENQPADIFTKVAASPSVP